MNNDNIWIQHAERARRQNMVWMSWFAVFQAIALVARYATSGAVGTGLLATAALFTIPLGLTIWMVLFLVQPKVFERDGQQVAAFMALHPVPGGKGTVPGRLEIAGTGLTWAPGKNAVRFGATQQAWTWERVQNVLFTKQSFYSYLQITLADGSTQSYRVYYAKALEKILTQHVRSAT